MREAVGEFEVIIDGDVEHLVPSGEQGHGPRSTCPCGPLRVQNVRGWYHRAMPVPS